VRARVLHAVRGGTPRDQHPGTSAFAYLLKRLRAGATATAAVTVVLALQSGKVLTLRCLDISCPGTIFPHHAKRLLLAAGRDAAVALFEKLSLEKGLEAIGAVAYCPRCSKVVVVVTLRHDACCAGSCRGV
jgi:hypothetical protein